MKVALAIALLGGTLLAGSASAQTTQPAPKRTMRPMPHKAGPIKVNPANNSQSLYAAPGEPINVRYNGKNTPPYDGPAAGHGNKPKSKDMTMPAKQ